MELIIKDNIDKFIRELDRAERRQVPFALSRALNDTAINAQEAIVKAIQIRFNNKKKWWTKSNRRTGVRVNFSSKDKLKSGVYTNAYFARIQEDGGIKTPRSGKNLAIPTEKAQKRFRKSSGAREALKQANTYATKKGIYKKTGKNKIQKLFSFTPSANIKPKFKFELTARVAVNRKIQRNFRKRLQEALRTAR